MNLEDNEKEMKQMWQETALPQPFDPQQMAREIAARVEKFDRTIYWRNAREYITGVLLIAWFLWMSQNPAKWNLTIPGIVAVSFVMIYLWRNQRKTQKPLDPALDVRSYQAALIQRYDAQIRLLSSVKYWYVLPLFAWMALVGIVVPSKLPGGPVAYFAVLGVLAGLVIWLNEGWGVRKLRRCREKAEKLTQ